MAQGQRLRNIEIDGMKFKDLYKVVYVVIDNVNTIPS